MSSIGLAVRSSQATKPARITAAMPKPPRMRPLVQPHSGASMMAAVRMPSPTVESTAPIGSSRPCSGSFESGTSFGIASSAATTIGTLMRKTAVQLNCSSSQPPLAGPMPTPMPATAAQMPIAFARSSAGKTLVMIDSVVGMISAPPMPMSDLVAMSMLADSAKAEASDAPPKMTNPATSAPRRLKRSPSAPIVSRRPAKTRV